LSSAEQTILAKNRKPKPSTSRHLGDVERILLISDLFRARSEQLF